MTWTPYLGPQYSPQRPGMMPPPPVMFQPPVPLRLPMRSAMLGPAMGGQMGGGGGGGGPMIAGGGQPGVDGGDGGDVGPGMGTPGQQDEWEEEEGPDFESLKPGFDEAAWSKKHPILSSVGNVLQGMFGGQGGPLAFGASALGMATGLPFGALGMLMNRFPDPLDKGMSQTILSGPMPLSTEALMARYAGENARMYAPGAISAVPLPPLPPAVARQPRAT